MTALHQKLINESLIWAEFLWETPQRITGKYKRPGWLVWVSLEATAQGLARELLPPLRELGMSQTRLLWIHLIMCHCYGHIVGPDGELSALQEMPEAELATIIQRTYFRTELPPIPDYALEEPPWGGG